MHHVHDPDGTTQLIPDRDRNAPRERTYAQIASIITQRDCKPISTAEVEQICRTAERKVARTLLRDPEVTRLFGSRATHG